MILIDLVDVVDGDLEALEDVLPRLGGVEVELGAPDDDLVAVVDEVLEQSPSGASPWAAPLTSASMMTPKVDCIGGVLVELVQHDAAGSRRA